ncbi:MAG: MoxR family ATPase [Verrucomicrobiales bacterium]
MKIDPFARYLEKADSALHPPPPWRNFQKRCLQNPVECAAPFAPGEEEELKVRAESHYLPEDSKEIRAIWAARVLRRPILITGDPGSGKSSLANIAAWYMKLGPVLRWNINSRSTLDRGLYHYDAVRRIQKIQELKEAGDDEKARLALENHGEFFRLGPLGTALLPRKIPRVLLIDEIDKSDLDLPNDLLHVLEEGRYEIPELVRLGRDVSVKVPTADETGEPATIVGGKVRCYEFPLILMTSNGERDFPSAFLRRCLRVTIDPPDQATLEKIVGEQMGAIPEVEGDKEKILKRLAGDMVTKMRGRVTTDQLLGTFFLEAEKEFDQSIEDHSFRDVTQSDAAPSSGKS